MGLIGEKGWYKDQCNELWKLDRTSIFEKTKACILYRKRDRHAQFYLMDGHNIDPTKPIIVSYLSKEKYPEEYL